jgi:hypothetical protein
MFPVNYVMRVGAFVFRTALGTKLAFAPRSGVAFEIDHYDSERGVELERDHARDAYDVCDAADGFSQAARGAHIHPLAPRARVHFLAVRPGTISGRRFRRLVSERFLG